MPRGRRTDLTKQVVIRVTEDTKRRWEEVVRLYKALNPNVRENEIFREAIDLLFEYRIKRMLNERLLPKVY